MRCRNERRDGRSLTHFTLRTGRGLMICGGLGSLRHHLWSSSAEKIANEDGRWRSRVTDSRLVEARRGEPFGTTERGVRIPNGHQTRPTARRPYYLITV
ncbi:hypothetical protein Mapa_012732 [Marchantia paleacea]|nr:hypothetical protein Mapa_012732 [Marchantia paleacea]